MSIAYAFERKREAEEVSCPLPQLSSSLRTASGNVIRIESG